MNSTVIFEDYINKETITGLLHRLNELDTPILFFSSQGGELDYANVLIEYLNIRKEEITLIGFRELSSSGFLVFYSAECKKQLLPYTFSVLHLADTLLSSRSLKDISSFDSFRNKEHSKLNNAFLKFYKDVLAFDKSGKMLESLKAGKDVYLSFDDLIKCLK